ncbi:hypothetical protein AB0O28_21275 [Microbispora sp. NPDC088329]|uniref:hypothetical protein n=1 Tax=Microbispora sp. NPDC088329 TaxID=3154869 RepID=UPI0034246F72
MSAILPRPSESRLVETRQRGWINPYAGAYVEHFWIVTWTDLAEPYEQRIISHLTVNMTIA